MNLDYGFLYYWARYKRLWLWPHYPDLWRKHEWKNSPLNIPPTQLRSKHQPKAPWRYRVSLQKIGPMAMANLLVGHGKQVGGSTTEGGGG